MQGESRSHALNKPTLQGPARERRTGAQNLPPWRALLSPRLRSCPGLVPDADRTDRNFQQRRGQGEEARAELPALLPRCRRGQEPRLQPGAPSAPSGKSLRDALSAQKHLRGLVCTFRNAELCPQRLESTAAAPTVNPRCPRTATPSSIPAMGSHSRRTPDAIRAPGSSQPIKGVF